MAVSVTGVGEAAVRAGLARCLAERLQQPAGLDPTPDAACAAVLRARVLLGQPPSLPPPPPDCGALALRVMLADSPRAAACGGAMSANAATAAGAETARVTPACPDVRVGERGAGEARWPVDRGSAPGSQQARSPAPGSAGGPGSKSVDGQEAAAVQGGTTSQEPAPVSRLNPTLAGRAGAVEVELVAVHSARSLGCAWWAPGMAAPRCTFLRQPCAPGAPPADALVCTFGVRAEWQLPA